MLLFEESFDSEKNYLPSDGVVNFYGKIFTLEEANFYYQNLLQTINWQNDEAIIFGKKNNYQTQSCLVRR